MASFGIEPMHKSCADSGCSTFKVAGSRRGDRAPRKFAAGKGRWIGTGEKASCFSPITNVLVWAWLS